MKYADKKTVEIANVFGTVRPNDAYGAILYRQLLPEPADRAGQVSVFLANVTFEPGCRNNWHIHHAAKRRRSASYCQAAGLYQEPEKNLSALLP
jgi:hypothetical protein